MADYDADRWLSRQLAWENTLDRLREKAGVEVPKEPERAARRTKPKRARAEAPRPTRAA